jgi:hypothetical protein
MHMQLSLVMSVFVSVPGNQQVCVEEEPLDRVKHQFGIWENAKK